ncbi:MAG: STAS domain-containing protein [Acidimicrobiia bacterium]|nr:STAS domain-containing protein [Acidimicrobiia bacterium]
MQITTNIKNDLIISHIEGRFDAHSVATYLTDVADAVTTSTPNVIVDLSGVEFMDSSALAALVTTLKRTMAVGGDLVLAGAGDAARIILELTRLDQVFSQADSLLSARVLLADSST